jgi:hypothetical protein
MARNITINGETLYSGTDIVRSLLHIERKHATERVHHLIKADTHRLEHIHLMHRDQKGVVRRTTFVTQALVAFMIPRLREAGIPGTDANKCAMMLARRAASQNSNPSQLQLTSDPANAEIESLRQQIQSLVTKNAEIESLRQHNQSLMMENAERLQQQVQSLKNENKKTVTWYQSLIDKLIGPQAAKTAHTAVPKEPERKTVVTQNDENNRYINEHEIITALNRTNLNAAERRELREQLARTKRRH